MLARGIRSYHRPSRLPEALKLVSEGASPLAGGTRLLASAVEAPNIVDLAALDLRQIGFQGGDLVLGALVTLQDLADSSDAHAGSAGLLRQAVLAQCPSWMIRNMATLGGEAVQGDPDSELLAALSALNAVFVVTTPDGEVESPALRFLRNPRADLGTQGLLTSVFVSAAPDGAALERVAVVPTAPPLVSAAVAISFSGDRCSRVRLALTGLVTTPARVPEAEARLEGTAGEPAAVERCLEQVLSRAPFRSDAHASAEYRKAAAGALVRRALERAMEQARSRAWAAPPRPIGRHVVQPCVEIPYFTSGPVELTVNGQRRRPVVEARTTLMDVLRREGFWGVKHGCETGECGACAVLLDGRPVNSCLTLAVRAQGRSVVTVEGLGTPEALHPIQQAFVDQGAIQCGYCTPAMLLVARALLDAAPRPTERQVREALAGCLCRCTGYVKPVQAVLQAAETMAKAAERP